MLRFAAARTAQMLVSVWVAVAVAVAVEVEVAVLVAVAVAVDRLGGVADHNVGGRLDLSDQVVRHRLGQGGAPHHHGDPGRVPGQVDRGLAGGVGPADHIDLPAPHGRGLGGGGAVEHPGPDQRLQPGHAQAPPRHPGGDDHRLGRHLGAVRQPDQPPAAVGAQPGGPLGQDQVGPEQPGLLQRPVGQVAAADPAQQALLAQAQSGDALSDTSFINKLTDGEGVNVIFEAAGIPALLAHATSQLSPAGRLVAMTFGKEPIPVNFKEINAKELTILGTRHQYQKFPEVVKILPDHLKEVDEITTHVFKAEDFQKAFDTLADRNSGAGKVVLTFA